MRFAWLALVAFVGACTTATTDPADRIITSQQDLCAGAAPETADHIVTAESCPFVQQADNVAKYGEALSTPTMLHDGTGAPIATITNTCDVWAMGTDAQGVLVIVKRSSGDVISHGSLHPGQPMSALATPRQLPFDLK